MLVIPHYVAPSPIHGLGCFASANVKKGEKVWEFHPIIDRVIPESDLWALPAHIVKLVQTHAEFFPETSVFRLAADGDFFMNHSDDPNFEDFGDYAIAGKDIAVGDEITWDYRIVKVWSFPLDVPNIASHSNSSFDVQDRK
jgi:hypothetical protein